MKILRTAVTLICVFAVGTLFSCGFSYAEIPRLINYQGKLTDKAGKPVSDGTYSITFRIYDQAAGGSPLWYETQSVSIQKGIFSTQIGATKDLNLAFDKPYYLGIKVGSDAEMTPRQSLSSVGYAFRAEVAENAVESDTALLAQDSNKLNNKDGSFYLNRANHTGTIGYDDLDPSMHNLLNSGSKTVSGFAGSGQSPQLSQCSINLLAEKTVYVNVSVTIRYTAGYGTDEFHFELLINGTTVARPKYYAETNDDKTISFSGSKTCSAGEVKIELRPSKAEYTTQFKNGIMSINW